MNADERDKIEDYLKTLGVTKAIVVARFGDDQNNWKQLRMNLIGIELIGIAEGIKHQALREVTPTEDISYNVVLSTSNKKK